MAIKEETYSRPCPVHGQLLTTKRTKTIRTKSGERYTKPFFYCSKCKAYYIIVDEFARDFKQKSLTDSGTPIYIVGKQKEVIPTNKEKQDGKKQKDEKHIIKYGTAEIHVIPKGTKLPKKCPFCEKETQELVFKIMSQGGGKRELRGKWCPICEEKFFSEELYKQHPERFVLKGDKKSVLNLEELIGTYLNSKDKKLSEDAEKELLDVNEEISAILLELLENSSGEERGKLLVLAMKKEPHVFLAKVVEEYGDDSKELIDKIFVELSATEINMEEYEIYFLSVKSQALLRVLLNRILTADITEKHETAKTILINYHDSIKDLKCVVEQLGIRNFTDIVMKISADLNLKWPTSVEEDTSLVTYENNTIEDLKNDTCISDEQIFFIAKDSCKVRILEEGKKLPSVCLECGHKTVIYRYETNSKGKIKKIPGRKCEQCKTCFFTNKVYKAHKEAFEKLVAGNNDSNTGLNKNKTKIDEIKVDQKIEYTEVDSPDVSKKPEIIEEAVSDTWSSHKEESVKENSDDASNFFQNDAKEDGWETKKKKYENIYNGPEAYLEAYQVKKCIVCGRPLNGDPDTAWVQCSKCKTIYCEESYKHIFSEPVIIIGKRK